MSGGSPFQTFYLMFKSNTKQAQKEVADLDKEIAGLASRGKARSEAETKQLESLRKQRREMTQDLKDQRKAADDTGHAFTNLVESATKAALAYVSFAAVKNGMANAQQFNRTLTIQSQLWKQNANEINAWGSAVKSAGGDLQGFIGWYDSLRQKNASIGRQTLPVGQLMQHIRGQVSGMSPEMAQMVFQQYGLGDPGAQALLQLSDSDFEKAIQAAKELTSNTIAGSAASQQFGKSWDNLTKSLEKFWTTINTIILPPLKLLIDGLSGFFNLISENSAMAGAFFTIMAASALAFTATIPGLVAGFGTIGTAALAAAVPMAVFLAKLAAVGAIGAGIVEGSLSAGRGIGHFLNRQLGRGDANGVLGGGTATQGSAGGQSAMDYLMTKHGMPAAQAAAMVANGMHESSMNPGAVGDGGRAKGVFQWHPDRRARIQAGTGIDVANTDLYGSLDAAVWELKARGQYDAFMSQGNAYDAASYFSQRFEVPAGGVMEAMRRGRTAMEIAGSTPFASQGNFGGGAGNSSVSIGELNVHTQATDSAGIVKDLKSELQRQISGVYSQNNDAVAY